MSAQSLCDKASGVVRCSREARVFDPDGSMWCHEHAPDPAGQSSATEAGDPETWTLPGSDVLGEFMAGGRRVYNLGKAEERELFQRETGIGEIHIPEIGFSYETVARITEPGSLTITPVPLDEPEPDSTRRDVQFDIITPPNAKEIESFWHDEDSPGRESVLQEAQRLIHGERNKNYGHPRDNFADIAALFSGYLGQEVNDIDVANLMILVKIARVKGTGYHRDSFTDIAGYAGCVELIHKEQS